MCICSVTNLVCVCSDNIIYIYPAHKYYTCVYAVWLTLCVCVCSDNIIYIYPAHKYYTCVYAVWLTLCVCVVITLFIYILHTSIIHVYMQCVCV